MCSETESAKKKRIATGAFRVWVVLSVVVWLVLATISFLYDGEISLSEVFDIYSILFLIAGTAITIGLGYLVIRVLIVAWFWIVKGFRGK